MSPVQEEETLGTDLVKDLNTVQQEAVSYGDGPLLVLAGAGSGKTRVLTYRIAHLIGELGQGRNQRPSVAHDHAALAPVGGQDHDHAPRPGWR